MADPESQTTPFAPSGVRSDDEPPYTTTGVYIKPKHQQTSKLLVHILTTIVILSSLFLILASIFLRVDNPKLQLNTVSIQNFNYENSNTTSLNVTMLTEVTVNNRNFGRYVFDDCNAVLLYGNVTIGGGGISGGRVGAKRTKLISVEMRIGSEDLNLSRTGGDDMELMEIRSFARMTGRVHVTKLVDRRKTIEMNCTISLNLTSRSFMDPILCS
ncbi:hypothetical protein QVD17_13485 [Tagetes erecta]|uniref:Late embryogenesis abundant protein LEA-2 subgroup domain-containing protein n=1 Tax=Tagetes erecta TaxID=13708 RepID=A0AAD8P3H2_TARER|nr:hypothetical protein QVD17_13485 [Tagetes erecta]